MPLKGTVGSGQVDHAGILSNRVTIDMDELIKRVDPNVAPFTVVVNKLGFKPCSAEKVEWMERDDFDHTVTLSAGAAADATTLVLASGQGTRITARMMLRSERTGETFYVESVSTDTLTVTPKWPDATGGVAHNAGEVLTILPTAMEDSSGRQDQVNLEPVAKFNFLQTSREDFKVSGRIQAVDLYGPGALEFARDDHMRNFLKGLEKRYLWGIRGSATVSGIGRVTTSGGIRYYMDTDAGSHQRDFGSLGFTKSEFDDFLREAFRFGSDRKMMICGWNVIRAIDSWGWNKLTINDNASSIGLTIRQYESSFGVLDIMPHRLWNEGGMGLEDECWICDMDNVVRRGLPGRAEMSLFTGQNGQEMQENGEDSTHMGFFIEDTLEVRNLETFSRAYNIAV